MYLVVTGDMEPSSQFIKEEFLSDQDDDTSGMLYLFVGTLKKSVHNIYNSDSPVLIITKCLR